MNSFNEKVVENLKYEVECLNHSLAKAREDKNFSMYKNLINSYRETVMLINELEKNNFIMKNMFSISPKGTFTIEENLRVNTHMIKNTIEKEIKENIEKIDCYRGREFISIEAEKFMDKYNVVIKVGFDIDVPVFRNRIRNIISSNILLKNFVDKIILIKHMEDGEFRHIFY